MQTPSELEDSRLASLVAEAAVATAESALPARVEAIRMRMVQEVTALSDDVAKLRSASVLAKRSYEECLHCCVRDGLDRG